MTNRDSCVCVSGANLRIVGQQRFVAGERTTIRLVYTPGREALHPGGHLWLLIDIRQGCGNLQASDPASVGYVRATTSCGELLSVRSLGETRPPSYCVRTLDLLRQVPEFLYVAEIAIQDSMPMNDDTVTIEVGADTGWMLPLNTIKEFHFWIIPDSEGLWQFVPLDEKYHHFICVGGAPRLRPLPVSASISVHPRPASRLDVVIPSFHEPGQSVLVKARASDELHNPCSVHEKHIISDEIRSSSEDPSGIGVEVHSSPDLMRVGVMDKQHALSALSNPSRALTRSGRERIYWGILHGMFFNQRPLDYYFDYARNMASLDFCAGMHFSYEAALTNVWAETREVVAQHCKPGSFVTFLGVECDPGPCGHKIVLYRDDDVPPLLAEQRPVVRTSAYSSRELDPDTIRCDSVNELWSELHQLGHGRTIVTAHHTADWRYHDPIIQRLAEIYSKWGTCEYPGNPLDRRPAEPPRDYVQEALTRGYRLGIIAGGDTHDSRPANPAPEPFGVEFPDGLTAVYATELTREAIWDALWHRRTYGTTGARILLQFEVNGAPMGDEVNLCEPAKIKVEAVGTAPIQSIELIRDNDIIHCWQGRDEQVRFEYEDDMLSSDRSHYYYVRLTQIDGQMAWSSPVWTVPANAIDLSIGSKAK